jgi:prephenate dehydrogenase
MSERPTLTIIGFGRMGKKFTEVFAEGFDVQVVSSRDVKTEVERLGAKYVEDFGGAIRSSDYIFIAVPIYALDSVVHHINQYVRPDTVAFDMCSARMVAAKKLQQLRCKHFGIHGGGVFGEPDPVILNYLRTRGYTFQAMSAQEHDEANAVVGLAHFIGMVLDSHLEHKDKQEFTQSPAASYLLRLIEHLRRNSPATYWETQICNPFTKDKRKELITAFIEYDKCLSEGEFPFADAIQMDT